MGDWEPSGSLSLTLGARSVGCGSDWEGVVLDQENLGAVDLPSTIDPGAGLAWVEFCETFRVDEEIGELFVFHIPCEDGELDFDVVLREVDDRQVRDVGSDRTKAIHVDESVVTHTLIFRLPAPFDVLSVDLQRDESESSKFLVDGTQVSQRDTASTIVSSIHFHGVPNGPWGLGPVGGGVLLEGKLLGNGLMGVPRVLEEVVGLDDVVRFAAFCRRHRLFFALFGAGGGDDAEKCDKQSKEAHGISNGSTNGFQQK